MRLVSVLTLVCVSSLLIGCSQTRDLVATHQVSIQTDPGNHATITGPEVVAKENDITISGTVTRKEGDDLAMAGHVDISVIDQFGNVTDTVAASLTPRNIPTTGDRSSTFNFQALGVPPAGSVIKATFVDELHPPPDDLVGMSTETGGGTPGSGRGGGGGGSHSSGGGGAPGSRMSGGQGGGGGHGFHFGGGHGGKH
jgi:hypothetical protein